MFCWRTRPRQVLPIKLTGALLALMSFWLCCRLSFLLPASIRSVTVAKLGNWHCRVCLWWCGFWRVTWIKVGQRDGDGSSPAKGGSGRGSKGGSSSSGGGEEQAQPVGIVSNHISWCDILIHMSHSFPSFVARSQTRKTPIIGIIRCGGPAAGRRTCRGHPMASQPGCAPPWCSPRMDCDLRPQSAATEAAHVSLPPTAWPHTPLFVFPAPPCCVCSQLMMCLYVDRDNKDPDAPRVSVDGGSRSGRFGV